MWNGGGKNFVPKIVRKEHQTYLHVWFGNLTHAFTRREVFFFGEGVHYGDAQYFWGHVFVYTTSAKVSTRIKAGFSSDVCHRIVSELDFPDLHPYTDQCICKTSHTHIHTYPTYPIRTVMSQSWYIETKKRSLPSWSPGWELICLLLHLTSRRLKKVGKMGETGVFWGERMDGESVWWGGSKHPKLQMISNNNHFIRTSFKQTKHLLTLFMSCEQKRMGLGGCWVFWTQRWWWVLELFAQMMESCCYQINS